MYYNLVIKSCMMIQLIDFVHVSHLLGTLTSDRRWPLLFSRSVGKIKMALMTKMDYIIKQCILQYFQCFDLCWKDLFSPRQIRTNTVSSTCTYSTLGWLLSQKGKEWMSLSTAFSSDRTDKILAWILNVSLAWSDL
jgi:hypothetical protein